MTNSDFRVTLLGTGVPIPSPDRFGPATLVEAGDKKFLIDAGRGAAIRLYQLEVPLGRIDVQFVTHYHSDHTSGVPDVWLTGWLESHYGRRRRPYRVIGPTGARELMTNLERAYALDIKIRVADEKLPLSGIATDVTGFDCNAAPELMLEPYVQRIIAHRTTPREARRVFAQTRPKLAAYTHIVRIGNELIAPPSPRRAKPIAAR